MLDPFHCVVQSSNSPVDSGDTDFITVAVKRSRLYSVCYFSLSVRFAHNVLIMSTAAALFSTICDFLRNLLNEISCQVTEETVEHIATCINRKIEVAYNSTKIILDELRESIKATACFTGSVIEVLTPPLWNFILVKDQLTLQ